MNYNGFKTIEIIPHQRYGLENHLQWLSNGKPGGNPNFITLTESIECKYLTNIEKTKLTDSVIWIEKKLLKNKSILAVIPARGGSKGIKLKNIQK